MTLPFTIDPTPTPRKVVVRIHADPDTNLSGFVRMYHRLTQAELADRLRCHPETVRAIERGLTAVSPKMARRLLKLLPRNARLDFLGIPHRGRPR